MPQMTKWCLRFAFWMTKSTDTHLEYEILIAFPWQWWFHTCTSMLCLYVHCPSWSTMTMLHGPRDLHMHFWYDPHYFSVFPAYTNETLPAKQQLHHLCHRDRGCQLIAPASKLKFITFWWWHNYSNSVQYMWCGYKITRLNFFPFPCKVGNSELCVVSAYLLPSIHG